MSTWYLVVCHGCTPVLPQPFRHAADRDDWIIAHKQGTGHAVLLLVQEDGAIRFY